MEGHVFCENALKSVMNSFVQGTCQCHTHTEVAASLCKRIPQALHSPNRSADRFCQQNLWSF